MKRKMSILILLGLSVMFGVSCGEIVAPTVIPTPDIPKNWWYSWLAQPVCQPPCWQNITPGVTTISEAVSILKNTPNIIITYEGEYGLSWNFGTKEEIGNINISEDGSVSSIWMGSSSKRSLYLEKIVATYNFPQYVKPYDCRERMCETALIYPDLGMFLSVFIENRGSTNNPRFEILSDTIIDRVYFIEQGLENFLKLSGFQDYDVLMEWKGYGEYP